MKLFSRKPKTLFIIRGLPGSGKSTLASQLTLFRVSNDDYPELYPNWSYEKVKLASQWCLSKTERWMQQGKRRIAVANTFGRLYYIEPYISLAKQYGYRISIIECTGNYGSVHPGVDEVVRQRIAATWEEMKK